MNKRTLMIFFIGLFLILNVKISGQTIKVSTDSIPFGYFIVDNVVSKERNPANRQRQLVIFMDERAFSEENLNLLFLHVSKKYPTPLNLSVMVRTTWDKIGNQDRYEVDGIGISELPANPQDTQSAWAYYERDNRVQMFNFYSLASDTTKNVVMRKSKNSKIN